MKKVWYLEGKENKKKKTVKLFVYEKEKVPTAHLDLSAFAELAQYDDWTIRFFHKDAPVLKEIICQKDSDFLKEALSGKGIVDADTAALLQRNRKELELYIRVGKFCFASGGVECPLPKSDQREEKGEKSDTDKRLEMSDEQKLTISFPLYEEVKKKYFPINLSANQNEDNFSISTDDIDIIKVNVIDPYILFQTESSPYCLSTETFFVWQLICEHLAKQDKYTASIPADWLTKAQLKELVSRQYLTPDSAWTLRLNRNYIIKQLSLKEAKEQYPQQYERSI